MPNKPRKHNRAVGYLVDLSAGLHHYVAVEGVGECREPFARLVHDLGRGDIGGVSVFKVDYLFIDTSPRWMEKLIATVKQRRVLIIDATRAREFDLNDPEDETAFRLLGKQRPQ